MEIEGKRILLSGATGGIGRAIAEQLAGRDAKLVLSSRRPKELGELAKSLPGGARRHKVIVCDLASKGAGEKLIREATEQFGEIDILVANAALPASGKLEGFTQRQLDRAIRVNLESPIKMTRELMGKLMERGEGHFVYVSSIAGQYATARSSLYSATKFGLRGFAFGLREDLHRNGVGVSIVSPGLVREAGMYADSGSTSTGGLGTTTPKKVAKAVVKAIRRNKSEITVAPFRQRRLAAFAANHPELAGRVTRNARAQGIADSVAEGQTEKR